MFSMPEIIWRKRQGLTHSDAEIEFLVNGYTAGSIPDYQVSAWLMAIYFRGLDHNETYALTRALIGSGETLDLSQIPGIKVDKHSTGGVGDKTTLVVMPLVRACGATVVKLAGRALGHTGGTLDKLEAIPGFKVNLTRDQIIRQAARTGMVLAGHTLELVPADKKLYALRDVTATADCAPLIAASIMSKKIAAGADAIVLDVKVGEGGFMTGLEQAQALAGSMVALGRQAGRNTVAILSRMDQPLGLAVGNALEVREAVEVLQGRGPAELTELCMVLAEQVLLLAGQAVDTVQARRLLEKAVSSGAAWERLEELIAVQGGDLAALRAGLPLAPCMFTVEAPSSGYIQSVSARQIGEAVGRLGGGRRNLNQPVDPGVGVVLAKKTGDQVREGEVLATVYARDSQAGAAESAALASAWTIGPEIPSPIPLILGITGNDGSDGKGNSALDR